jgi:hypothetical protein
MRVSNEFIRRAAAVGAAIAICGITAQAQAPAPAQTPALNHAARLSFDTFSRPVSMRRVHGLA